jgi:cation diffusion facilitator CzcD-associated flavoprotein CzcO
MSFWSCNMPAGMLLRSPWDGSHIADPRRALTLDAFRSASGSHFSGPVPLGRFVEYGLWFQKQAVPTLDRRWVTRIDSGPIGFRLTLEDGAQVDSRRVVIAAGIETFTWRPPEFNDCPSSLVSHTCEQRELANFAGKRVLVVGAGQSALESAALLHEAGADAEVVVRAPTVRYLGRRPWLHTWRLSRLLYAPPDVGPAGVSHLVARPNYFNKLPRSLQDYLSPRSIRPAGARWLEPRLADVRITANRFVVSADRSGDQVRLTLDDGSTREADHVLLGTGYRVDISKYRFLTSELLGSISRVNGYPRLNEGFEASVPGLHFLGAPAAWSFGPLMRFVAGTEFAAPTLTRWIEKARARGC